MKVRILYTQETIGSGGVERRRFSLIQALDKNLYEIKIICTKTEGPLADEMRKAGVEVVVIGLLSKIWEIDKYRAVLKVIHRFQPHIIHGAVFEGVLLATVAGTLGRVPIIIAEETSDPQFRSKKANILIKGLSYLSDKFVGVSPAAYDYLLTKANLNPKKVKLIVNGVATPANVDNRLVAELKSRYGFKEEDLVIGSVGRLFNKVKLFTDLVDAVSVLKEKYPSLKLLIVGDGPDRDLILEYASKKRIIDRVVMAGYQSDPHPFFKLMDVFALVSSTESFGLAVVEAMFHQLPVIASEVGGLKYIVKHNETGLLVEVNQPQQIASALERLLVDKDLRKSMGLKGKLRAQTKYSENRYVNEVKEMYDELLRQKYIK